MKNFIEDNEEDQFANGQSCRDLLANSGAAEPRAQLDAVNVIERCPDVTREGFSASENWERELQWRGSQFVPEQIDADERLPGYLRKPHLPRFELLSAPTFAKQRVPQGDRALSSPFVADYCGLLPNNSECQRIPINASQQISSCLGHMASVFAASH